MSIKVLMFGWEFPPFNSGGLGTACLGLTRALSRSNVGLLFVLPKKVNLSADYLKFLFADVDLNNFNIEQVPGLLYPYITSDGYTKMREEAASKVYGRNLLEEVKLYGERAAKIARKNKFDIIHAHDWLAFPAGIKAKKISGKPLVVHIHATEFDRTGGNGVNQNVYNIEREGMHYADGIITVSSRVKNMIMQHYGVPGKKIQVVHNGIDLTEFHGVPAGLEALRAGGNRIVLFLGRITLQKGPDYFIHMAKKVLEHTPNVYFVVSGSGDMEHQMMRLAASYGISDRIIYAGFARGRDVEALYKGADIYVMPSVSEPFGLTPLESMANGTPVLMSKQSGVSEVVSHALKTHFWDIDEMASQLITLLQNDSLAKTLSERGFEEVKHINWDKAAAKCVNFYEQLMAHPI